MTASTRHLGRDARRPKARRRLRIGPSAAVAGLRGRPRAPRRLGAHPADQPRHRGPPRHRAAVDGLPGACSRAPAHDRSERGRQRPRQHDRPGGAARPRRAVRRRSAFKAGLFNIGAQGQFLIGALASAGTGAAVASWPGPSGDPDGHPRGLPRRRDLGLHPGRPQGVHRRPRGRHDDHAQLRSPRRSSAAWSPGRCSPPGFSFDRTGDLGNAALPIIFGTRNRPPRASCLASLAVPVVWWLLYRSTLGFEIRTVGANPNAARYAGHAARAADHPHDDPRRGCSPAWPGACEILGVTHFMNASLRHDRRLRLDHRRPARPLAPGRDRPRRRSCSGRCGPGAGLMQIQAEHPGRDRRRHPGDDPAVPRRRRHRPRACSASAAPGGGLAELQTVTQLVRRQSAVALMDQLSTLYGIPVLGRPVPARRLPRRGHPRPTAPTDPRALATPLAPRRPVRVMNERSGVVNIGIEGMMLTRRVHRLVRRRRPGRRSRSPARPVGRLRDRRRRSSSALVAAIARRRSLVSVAPRLAVDHRSGPTRSSAARSSTSPRSGSPATSTALISRRTRRPAPAASRAFTPPDGADATSRSSAGSSATFLDQGPITISVLVLVVVLQILLFRSRWGLRTRAVGEHPKAAETVGIDVIRLRYRNVIARRRLRRPRPART